MEPIAPGDPTEPEGPARLRPLQVGEVVDAAIKIYRSRFSALAKSVFLVIAPLQILITLIEISIPDDGFRTNQFGTVETDTGAAVGASVAIFLIFVLTYLGAHLATATSLQIVSDAYLGRRREWFESMMFALHKFKSLAWVGFLYFALLMIGMWPCGAGTVYMYAAFSVVVPVVLLEDIRGTRALHRSRRLVEGRWWPVAGCLLIAYVLSLIGAFVIGAVVGAASIPIEDETIRIILDAIGSIAASTLVTPFSAAVFAVIYFDLRVRKEGFDLELLAQSVGGTPTSRWQLASE